LYQFFFIESGSGTFIFNEKSKPFSGMNIVIMPDNNLHGFQFSEDIKGFTLSVSSYIIDNIIREDKELAYEINRVRLINLNSNKDDFCYLMRTIHSINKELSLEEAKIDLSLKALLTLLLIKIYRIRVKTDKDKEYVGASRELAYYKIFMKTLKSVVPTNKSIDDFTKVFGISKTHLNRVCQTIANKSTNQVISQYLVNEAMILLAHTDMTISEIAHQLEFKDVSYFCRFFKKQAGQSPAKFRDENAHIEQMENAVILNY
jgi:AraC family transcriptional activator of pobA